MRGQCYENDDVVQEALHSWLQDVGINFYHRIFKFMQCQQKCMDGYVDGVEM
jgi:hypothetical protein